jgi:1,4-alpha-glucan branching enzyme
MPQAIQPIAERFPALEEQEVEFTFCAPEAHMVEVAGTFNNWHQQANPLDPTGTGDWTTKVMLKSGRYEYRFIIDGVWTDDPQALLKATNSFGGFNSVLQVGLDDRTDLL